MSVLFDYQQIADRLGVPAERLAELVTLVRRQYGSDEMLAELRLLRTLKAIEDGELSLAEAIVEFQGTASPSVAPQT
jgi:hypothetical protein